MAAGRARQRAVAGERLQTMGGALLVDEAEGGGSGTFSDVSMKATTLRFNQDLFEMVEREAARQQVSTAQFIREATLLRVAALAGKRGDVELVQDVEDLALRAERRARRSDTTVADPLAPVHDAERLAAVRATGLLDTPHEDRFDRLTAEAAEALGADKVLLTLIDDDRQFIKSEAGESDRFGGRRETPLSHSFCQHVVAGNAPLLVEDAREDPRLRTNLAIEDLGVVAYAGVPLMDADGHTLGAMCAIGHQPREWTRDDLARLVDLAERASEEIGGR